MDEIITLPPGTSIVSSIETSQASPNGTIEAGMRFTLRIPSGATTSVFIPYALLGSTAAVAAALTERVQQIQAIEALSNPGS